MTKALYAGSFDPFTLGHANIVMKAISTFDEVHIALGTNPRKTPLFMAEESIRMINETFDQLGLSYREMLSITVGEFQDQSIAAYARKIGATHIVRGLRQASDFNDEFVIRGAIEHMAPELILVHFICDHEWLHVSSSTARELAKLGEDVSWLVTKNVEDALLGKFRAR